MRYAPVVLSALFFAGTLHADIDRTKAPAAGPAPEAAFPDYQTVTLPNGLKVFVIDDERKPTLTLRLVIRSGSIFDGPKTGLASMVARLLPRGTESRDAATFARQTDFIGAQLAAEAGSDAVSVTISGLTKNTDQLLDFFSDAVLHPAFAPEQLARAERQTLSMLAAEKQEPGALAGKIGGKVLYGQHPYGAYTTPATVKSIQRDDLVAFHKAHFLPNNASLAVVGDVKAAAILPLIEKALGGWARGEVPQAVLPAIPVATKTTVHIVDRPGSVQSNIVIEEAGPKRSDPDLPELNVLNATLGGGFSGRLFQNLREKHGWTYGAYSAFDFKKLAGSFEATAETRNEVTEPAIAETIKEMQRIRDEPVPEAELKLQRQYNVGNYLLSLENAGRTAQRVQDIDLYGLPADFYKHYASRMGNTTSEQVLALGQKYLHLDQLFIVVVGEARQIKPQLEKFGPVYVYDTDLKLVP
jgi:predicted Zn-dependent peptidase